jgi:hypothetical protein
MGSSIVRNTILWGNQAAAERAKEIFNHERDGGTSDIRQSNVRGGWAGNGNINTDPLFVAVAAIDFRLQSTSPCIGQGLRTALPPDIADLDWDGNTTEPTPLDLGGNPLGTATNVDMGAIRRSVP